MTEIHTICLKCIFVLGILTFTLILKANKKLLYDEKNQAPRRRTENSRSTSFPVDAVYTWVNGSDPEHQERLKLLKKTLLKSHLILSESDQTIASGRFTDLGGLRVSLRSLEENANWIRHIFIVTNGQIPHWLNLSNPRITIVTHEELFDNPEDLPTFSSPAIEFNLHKIPGISERFIYMNDDILFGRKISITDFYTETEGTKVFLEHAVSTRCNNECKPEMVHNGVCDEVCNYDHCAWDAGDCKDFDDLRPYDPKVSHCAFTTSLFYTNAVYTQAFGFKKRKVIAHAPLFIHRSVNREMVKRFRKEIEETIHHKVRNPLDMQFAFSYMHFLKEGTNGSHRTENKVYSSRVAFIMESTNIKRAIKEFTQLLLSRRKFICINDNIDYTDTAKARQAISILDKFYRLMFPRPSSFEIP